MRGKARYEQYRLRGVRRPDGTRILTHHRYSTRETAALMALNILRGTSYWMQMEVLDAKGRVVQRIDKPAR